MMKYKITAWLLACLLCGLSHSVYAYRGELISYELIDTRTKGEVRQLLNDAVDGGFVELLIGVLLPVNYDVDVYKVIYETIDPHGKPVIASGVVYAPKNYTCKLPIAAYLHGTLTKDADAPSTLMEVESGIGYGLATDGYLAVLPDYLGLGLNDGKDLPYHPYQHADTEASATIDILFASRQVARQIGLNLSLEVFLSGYSQGAHAALATQREIEARYQHTFIPRIVIAGGGPYDLSGVQFNFVFDRNYYENPSFLPYVLFGYQEIYGGIYDELDEVFVAPFDQTVPTYFDGSLAVEEIDALLPPRWKNMFRSDFLGEAQRSNSAIRTRLRENSLINWKPQTDLRMYFCTGDELVTPINSIVAWWNFFLKGTWFTARAVPIGPFKHRPCASYVLVAAKLQFNIKRRSDCNVSPTPEKRLTEDPHLAALMEEYKEEYEEFMSIMREENLPELEDLLAQYGQTEMLNELRREEYQPVSLYPNPVVSDEVLNMNLSRAEGDLRAIQVFDLTGNVVDVPYTEIAGNQLQLSVRGLKPGYYTIKIVKDQVHFKKLLVK